MQNRKGHGKENIEGTIRRHLPLCDRLYFSTKIVGKIFFSVYDGRQQLILI